VFGLVRTLGATAAVLVTIEGIVETKMECGGQMSPTDIAQVVISVIGFMFVIYQNSSYQKHPGRHPG
jgi:hypothetical protein